MQCERGKSGEGDLKPETENRKKVKVKVWSGMRFLWDFWNQKGAGDSGIGRGQLGFIGLS